MIEFRGVSKTFNPWAQEKHVLYRASFTIPAGRNVAVIGRNGSGKSTLINLMSGALRPDRGIVRRHGRVSWPLAFGGGFHPLLTGRQNAKFVARIYHVDVDHLLEEVQAFSELGPSFDLPIRTYSQGMKSRLAFGVSMSVNFDCYLIDEIIGVGDMQFRAKCQKALRKQLESSQLVMASHSENGLRDFCDCALHVENGKVAYFDDLEEGLESYKNSQENGKGLAL